MSGLCYNCFNEYSGSGSCPNCGFVPVKQQETYPHALQPGSILDGRYIVGRVLGQGGFGISYVAQDYNTKALVAIKEFMPGAIAHRIGKTEVGVFSVQNEGDFSYGRKRFFAEAETLAQFNGRPGICNIYSYFEENNTAYYVMEYVEGYTLSSYLEKRGGPLSVSEAVKLLIPVMHAMNWVHMKGIVHRDIAPDNIMVRPDGTVTLIDFGAARHAMGEKSQSMTVLIKHGFAPKEQYSRHSNLGAYTDVYAMAASFYYAITGEVPPDSIDRSDNDTLVPPSKLGVDIPRAVEKVLLKALAISHTQRYQNMGEFAIALMEAMEPKAKKSKAEKPGPEPDRKPKLIAAVAAACVLLLVIAVAFSGRDEKKDPPSTMPPASVEIEQPGLSLDTAAPELGPEVEDISWDYDKASKTLYISGSGTMKDYTPSSAPPPWQTDGIPVEAERVVIAEGITHIGSRSFYVFTKLSSLELPESLDSIGYEAFFGCDSLREVELPKGVSKMDFGVFKLCDNLVKVKLSNNLQQLPLDTFRQCKSLKYVDFGNSPIKSIGQNAFNGCSSLEEVHLPVQLTTILDMAFYNCSSLRYVDMWADVANIWDYAFYGCDSLDELCFWGSQASWDKINIMEYNEPLLNADIEFNDFNIG